MATGDSGVSAAVREQYMLDLAVQSFVCTCGNVVNEGCLFALQCDARWAPAKLAMCLSCATRAMWPQYERAHSMLRRATEETGS